MVYVYLALAIVGEAIGTAALKASDGFRIPALAATVVAAYAVAAYFLSLTTQTMSLGIVYAIWCAAGIVLVSLIGYFGYGQTLDAAALLGLALIVAGVAVLNLLSNSVHQ